MTPRAVTGLGVVSALGIGRAAFYDAMKSGVVPRYDDGHVETFDASKYPRLPVAEVRGFDATKHLGDKGLRSLDRLTKLLIVAARQALDDSGLKKDGAWAAGSADTVGIVVSNAYGSLEAINELDRVATLEDARYINPSRFPLTVSNSAAGYTSIWEEIRAVNVSVSDGNCGALDAAACADVFLDQARARTILVGGAEAMSEALFLAFHKLGALGGQASGSEGLCIGEGAALLALEDRKTADARGAHVLAELVGYGTSFVPPAKEYALVHASSEALETAIQNALIDAQVEPSAIDVVVSGVSGLRVFDEAELLAIRRATREGVTILTPKKSLGETLGAGGAMGMLAAIGALNSSSDGKPVARTALVTSLGYYGNASAVVMRSATATR